MPSPTQNQLQEAWWRYPGSFQPVHHPNSFILGSCSLPGFSLEVRFIDFSEPMKFAGNTWPRGNIVWGPPFSESHSLYSSVHDFWLPRSHMLLCTCTCLYLHQLGNLYIIWGTGEFAYIISKISPWFEVLTPFFEIQKRGRVSCFPAVSLLSWTQARAQEMGWMDRDEAWEVGKWAWVSHLTPQILNFPTCRMKVMTSVLPCS